MICPKCVEMEVIEMPIVMCSFCQYIGKSKGKYRNCCQEYEDVLEHEKECDKNVDGKI